jgi:hypothetical protein
MYTPATRVYMQGTEITPDVLDPDGVIIDRPTPSDPVYVGLPDSDAPIDPQPKPPIVTPRRIPYRQI